MNRYEIALAVVAALGLALGVIALVLAVRYRRLGRKNAAAWQMYLDELSETNAAMEERNAAHQERDEARADAAKFREHLAAAIRHLTEAAHDRDAALDLAQRAIDKVPAPTTRKRYAAQLAALRRPPDDDTT